MRSVVAESWRRSAEAGVTIDTAASPITLPEGDLADYREAHPLAFVYPVLDDLLGGATRACDALLALTDDRGQLLWVSGTLATLRRAERIGFVEGSNWDERLAGTNAPGTALVLDRPTVVVGEEHYRESVKEWNCFAAPIHDPASGQLLGVLDITGGPAVVVPQTLAMVRAAAQLAEAELARTQDDWRHTHSAPDERAPFAMQALGRREALLSAGGRTVVLSPRHSEVLAILSMSPTGLGGDELAFLLYPEPITGSTVRAEMNRVRSTVGDDLVGSRPYRLLAEVSGDWHAVRGHLARGDVVAALRHYRGPLLPHSQAPGVRHLREDLEQDLRHAVLASGRVDLMGAWTRSSWGADDYDKWRRQSDLLPSGSPLRHLVRTQVARLDREFGPA